jgi:hypothetical protein
MTTLVGPLPTITFQGGERAERQVYDVPRNTLDPRYALCTRHHPACDCREAELREMLTELLAESKTACDVAGRVLLGHRIYDLADRRSRDGYDGARACLCSGCEIARRAHLVPIFRTEYGIVR